MSSVQPAKYYDPDQPLPPIRKKRLTAEQAKLCTSDDPVRIYADGIFDMFHVGHSRALMQAKALFPYVYLIVGVCSDDTTREKKGLTVMTEAERYMSVLHCRYVDEVIKDAPWVIDKEFLALHRIDFVAHDNIPYASSSSDDVYGFVKAMGSFIPIKRTEFISTSDIITRIVRNYDNFVRRNLFRGYTRDDLNIGYFNEKRIRINDQIMGIKRKLDSIENYTDSLLRKWEDKSHQIVYDFINSFGSNGRLAHIIKEGKTIVKDMFTFHDLSFDSDQEKSEDENTVS